MTTHQRRFQLSHLAIAGAFLLAGLASAGQSALAGPSAVDDGGSGGSGAATAGRPIFLEHFGLVATNDGPGSFTMNPAPDGPTLVGSTSEREIVVDAELDGPTLVGSTSEREIVADSDGQETAGTLSDADIAAIISASGGNGQAIFADSALDETARSTSLIALYPTANVEVAIQHRGQPY